MTEEQIISLEILTRMSELTVTMKDNLEELEKLIYQLYELKNQ